MCIVYAECMKNSYHNADRQPFPLNHYFLESGVCSLLQHCSHCCSEPFISQNLLVNSFKANPKHPKLPWSQEIYWYGLHLLHEVRAAVRRLMIGWLINIGQLSPCTNSFDWFRNMCPVESTLFFNMLLYYMYTVCVQL